MVLHLEAKCPPNLDSYSPHKDWEREASSSLMIVFQKDVSQVPEKDSPGR